MCSTYRQDGLRLVLVALIGGHLAANSKLYTTAEIVIPCTNKYHLKREKDGSTPWEELQIIDKP